MKVCTYFSVLYILFLFPFLSLGNTIYVDIDATGSDNGTTWNHAYNDLQDAINAAAVGDIIWVAQGTYLPQRDHTGNLSPADPRDKVFYLNKDIVILGGFDGSESDFKQRDIENNVTRLSGDIGVATDSADNCYHVLMTSTLGKNASIDGFTISHGNADGSGSISFGGTIYRNLGGGLTDYNSTRAKMNNLTISENYAEGGGGIYMLYSWIHFHKCTIHNNTSKNGGGLFSEYTNEVYTQTKIKNNRASRGGTSSGGGLFCNFCKSAFYQSEFTKNTCDDEGGAAFLYNPSQVEFPIFEHVKIDSNEASNGGGIHCFYSSSRLVDCEITNNTATLGGAVYNAYAGQPIIIDGLIADNQAQHGGGVYAIGSSYCFLVNTVVKSNNATFSGGGIYHSNGANIRLVNAILIDNSASYGGGIYATNSTPFYWNSTFYNNEASNLGGAIYCGTMFSTDIVHIKNCLFKENKVNGMNNVIYADIDTVSGSVLVEYALTQENSLFSSGTGIINNIDPQFIDESNPIGSDNTWQTKDDGLALQNNSTILEKGFYDYAPYRDFLNKWRPLIPSLGAYENLRNPGKLYVDSSATAGLKSGLDWANAFVDLTEALRIAINGDTIYMAEGIYFATDGYDATKSFQIQDSITIIGGYSSAGLVHDPLIHQTILSGNIGDLNDTIDNTHHVLTIENGLVKLSGLTIQEGNASYGSLYEYGGGVFVKSNVHAILDEVNISGNRSEKDGSGLYLSNPATLKLIDCNITNNSYGGKSNFDMELGAELIINPVTTIE